MQCETFCIIPAPVPVLVPVPDQASVNTPYSVLEAPPLLLAHVYLRGVWLRPKHVTLEIHIERTTIRVRVANKDLQTYTLKPGRNPENRNQCL